MFIIRVIGVVALGVVLALSGLSGLSVRDIAAQETQAALEQTVSIGAAIEQQLGKRAKLKLVSGQDLEGKVVEVGDEVVVIAELTGMEFFSATVVLDQIAAIIETKAVGNAGKLRLKFKVQAKAPTGTQEKPEINRQRNKNGKVDILRVKMPSLKKSINQMSLR